MTAPARRSPLRFSCNNPHTNPHSNFTGTKSALPSFERTENRIGKRTEADRHIASRTPPQRRQTLVPEGRGGSQWKRSQRRTCHVFIRFCIIERLAEPVCFANGRQVIFEVVMKRKANVKNE